MIHNQNRLTFIRLSILAFWAIGFLPTGTAQVPVDQLPQSPEPNSGEINQTPSVEEFGLGVLSDPAELSLVDGLDEELERLRLRDQDTTGILEMIQIITGRYILRPQNLPQVKINFDSFTVLTKRETLRALESLLAMNGIGISKIDDQFFKAVPASGMNVHVPIWLDGPALAIKPSQRIYVKMFHLEYAPALEVREQLNPFSTPNVGTLIVFEKANSILATDSLLNLQRMEQLLEAIDRPIPAIDKGLVLIDYNCSHIAPKQLDELLKSVLQKAATDKESLFADFIQRRVKTYVDGRSGKLFAVVHEKDSEFFLRFIKSIDVPVKVRARSQDYKLQYALEEEIVKLILQIIEKRKAAQDEEESTSVKKVQQGSSSDSSNRSDSSDSSASSGSSVSSTTTIKNNVSSQGTDVSNTDSDENQEFSSFVSVLGDKRSNAILVYGTESDLSQISDIIRLLDKPLPMAQIDTIFLMVTMSGGANRGIELFSNALYTESAGGTVTDPQTKLETVVAPGKYLNFDANLPGVGGPMTFGFLDSKLNNVAWNNIFKIAQSTTNTRVFSSPSLVVTHNAEEVEISMKNKRTVFSESSYNSTTGGQSQFSNNRDFESETTLRLLHPRISPKQEIIDSNNTKLVIPGSVYTEVELITSNFSDIGSSTYNGQSIPATQERKISTSLSFNDNDIIALGGLQQVKQSNSRNEYAMLRKIPILGKSLFSPKTEDYEPSELLIFIRARIFKQGAKEDFIDPSKIDVMMNEAYVPQFTSPNTGNAVVPKMVEFGKINSNKTSTIDQRSRKPIF
jgi:general secretion pathway protein D